MGRERRTAELFSLPTDDPAGRQSANYVNAAAVAREKNIIREERAKTSEWHGGGESLQRERDVGGEVNGTSTVQEPRTKNLTNGALFLAGGGRWRANGQDGGNDT